MADLTLKKKTCLITGASGAIGGAIANKLSSLGANVILTGTNKKKIEDLEKKLGPNSLGLIADLSKDEEIDNLYNESIKKFKSLLSKQITMTVKWRETILFMESEGVKRIFEVGPGNVLSGLVKRITKNIECFSIQNPEDMDNLE